MFAAKKRKFVLKFMNTRHVVTVLYTPGQIHTVLRTLDMFFLQHFAYTLHADLPEGPQVSCLVVERSQLVPMV